MSTPSLVKRYAKLCIRSGIKLIRAPQCLSKLEKKTAKLKMPNFGTLGGAFQVYPLRVDEDEELLVACDSYVRMPHKLSDGHIFFHGSVYSRAFSFHHNCASGVTRWDRPMEVQREEHQVKVKGPLIDHHNISPIRMH